METVLKIEAEEIEANLYLLCSMEKTVNAVYGYAILRVTFYSITINVLE